MTLFCKIFRALNHLTFSMHFNFWEMQVLSWYQDDTHLSVTNFKSNPPLAQQTLNPWDEGGEHQQRLELWQNRHFTISHAKRKFLNASKCQFSIFFLVFKCIQWFTNTRILWKDSQMTQIFISWFYIFTHEQMFEKKLAILCNQKRQHDNLLEIYMTRWSS